MKKIKSILIIIFSISIIFSIFNIGKVLASVNTIKITNVQIKEKSTGVDASIVSYDNDDVKANVEYHKVNDYVIFNVTLKNNDTKKYTIKTITDDNLNGNIVYEYDKHENEEFNSNEEKVLEIKSTYKTEVNNMDKRVVNNSVKFNIIFVDEDGNESSKVIPINPKTGDNIGIYLLILIISLVGLLSITIQKNKKIRSSLLIALLLIPITAQAANLNFIISFNENIKLYDKLLVKINGEEKIIPYNSKIDKPENPSKPGYTFDNWYSGNEVFDFTKEIKEDTTITPKFNIITYNINYDYAGGTATNPTTYTVEDKITLNNPTKEGYTFAGWTGTEITTQTTSVTIQKGSTEDRSYVAHFSTNQNTKYTVVHKYQKLDPTQYETEEVEEHGATDTEVAAPRKPKAGFETPEEQNVTIKGDGEAKVTYVYNRKTYTLNVTNRTYLDETSTANGTYPYETQITLKAQEREGYTFKWNDNDTNYTKSFKLTENKELTPIYTANQNTKYTVVHKYQKLDPTQYETEEVEEHGTTDETVPAPRKPKAGFETPEEQNIKITGDGEARVTYVYNRETYTFTINDSEYVDSTKESGNYPYETQITISPKERAGFTFTKWSDNTTDNPKTITLTSNVTISPVYEANELDFNGDETISKVYSTSSQNVTINPSSNGSGNYTYTITEGNTNNYFSISGTTLTIKENTPASEYTIKIKAKDNVTSVEKIATFKITITKQQSDAVTNLNVSPEGIVSFTNSANADGYLISIDGINYTPVLPGSETTTYNYLTQVTAVSGTRTVYVKAINSDSGNYDESDPVSKDVTVYKLSINVSDDTLGEVSQSSINVINGATYASSENKLTLSDEREVTTSKKTITGYTITFDGWSLENGTISQDTTITANYSKTINKYTVTFDTDGGSNVPSQTIDHGGKVTKPTPNPEKENYEFDNWYTTDSYQTEFDFENTVITKTTTIYAKFNEINYCAAFENDSWNTIVANIKTNPNYYRLGCEKNIEMDLDDDNTTETYTLRLVNRSTPEICSTEGFSQTACGTVIEFKDAIARRQMNSTRTNEGGWKASNLATWLNSDLYDKLPSDLKTVIIPTYPIVSGAGNSTSSPDITETDTNLNRLYLANATDVGVTDGSDKSYERNRVLDYYINTALTVDETRTKYLANTDTMVNWWLRTSAHNNNVQFVYTHLSGQIAKEYADNANKYVVPFFRIGTISEYTVTFNTYGGSEISDIKVNAGDSINELPTPTKDGSIFLGWFEKTTDENPVSAPYTPSGDIELIAKWQKMICKKATTLHTETCNQTNSTKFCIKDGFANGDTITYGNIVSSDTYTVGDALDCDVDGTGYNQRFYYLRTNDNKAVLISNTNYTAASGQSDINSSFIYSQAHDQLPTISEWSNLTIKFDGKPARLITIEDILTITGAANASDLKDTGSLKGYEFLFENSNFSGIGERSTQWVEEISSTERYRYRNDSINLAQVESGNENTSKNPVRPVIEVPVELIKDDYIVKFNPNGGIVSNKYANVQKGEKIGTLPTATRNDYIFAGWYTSLDFTIPVNENTIPNGYVTYYAKWLKPVEEAQLEHDSFILNIDESKTINVLNSHELENYTFTSSNSEVASVTNEGVITGVSVGEATITMRGTVSDTTKEIHVNVQQEGTTYNVEFDSQGGEEVESINVNKNTAIGILPVTTKENKLFVGWYTSLEYTEKVTETTIIDSDKKYYARWADADDVAEMNNEFYKSIQTAVNTAPTTKTTITLLQDVSINAFINMYDKNTNKDIVLDLNNHTLTGTAGQTIKTKIPLEIKNGAVIQTSSNGTIDIGPGGHLIINSGRVENSGERAAIYNDGGIVEIGKDAYLTSNAVFASNNKRGTVQNKSGTTIITGGTIINTRSSSSHAVAVSAGTFTLGTQDGAYDTSSITLQGNTNGIYSDVNYSVYDGVIKGKDAAVNNESKITSTEANSTKINTEEATYKVLYYNIELSKYEITLNPDGGEVNPTLILVDQGNKVGTLPTPSKGIYTFDGWYNESNEAVDENTVPTKNETYTAKWTYDVNPNVVSFRTTPDAQKTYYQYIDTWKNSSTNFPSWSSSNNGPNWPLDATENTVMMQNFNNNNCMCADNQCSSTGTVHCDKPKGYNTGVNGKVSVYTYNETSGEKDTKVTYAKGDNGVIYNLIPDKVYYWELDSDEDVHGLVKFTSERRIIDAGDVLNVRDLGGLPADTDGDNIPDATLAYGRLFRGIKLNSSSSITELTNLGINSELDLREASSDAYKISRYNRIEAQNYFVNPNGETDAEKGYYTMTRNAVKYAMEEIVAGNNLYYHCRIGTDRTGTVSYVLEGLLGVPEEDRVQDYELSFFYGLVRIHRYHNEKPGSGIGTGKERFVYMHDFMPTNSDIYNWYMQGTTNQTEDEKLIEDFRNAMIEK